MPNCPKCQSEESKKDGFIRGKQRYCCKRCGYRHTVAYKWYSEETKRQALKLYLEGLGFRSIGRLLNCSHVAVYQWIKQYGEKAQLVALPTTELEVVEMDEMHTYVGSKKSLLGVDSR
jgi:transposase-like protein